MKIESARFITSVAAIDKYAQAASAYSCPEVCVVGRSNVGKSTFINCITGRKKLAKASTTPGRTRLINLFDLNFGTLVLADLPGYGYAAAPKADKKSWATLIEGYLRSSQKLAHVFALVDIRHEPSALDKQMLAYLYAYRLPFTVVATKADKLSRAQVARAKQTVYSSLEIGRDNVIVFSGTDGTGKAEIEGVFDRILSAANADGE